MYRGSTTELNVEFEENQLEYESIEEVRFTIQTLLRSKTFTLSDGQVILSPEKNTISVLLSQEDTLYFSAGDGKVQLKIYTKDGESYLTDIMPFKVYDDIDGRLMP